jgi:hypothetical protein
MSTTDHDAKCELERQNSILEEFGSWEVFNELPERVRLIVSGGRKIDWPVSACKCARRKRNRDDFIRLWTAAGSAKNYDKGAWKNVESQLFDADEF